MRILLVLVLLLGACSEKGKGSAPPAPGAPSPPDRETWWNAATRIASGGERILAPREIRELLTEGRRLGYDRDAEWWGRRGAWASERILALDPEDIDANALGGRRSLQSIDGFEATWKRMAETRAPTAEMTEMLDRYGPWVEEGRVVFLTREEFEVERARLGEAAAHLDRLERDPGYAAEQRMLLHVKASAHGKYPFVHARVGPFLVFYAARDLTRDPEADPAAEEERLAACREVHLKRLAEWTSVYTDLVDDMRTLYPAAWAAHPLAPDHLFPQWIFSEAEWYQDFAARVRRDDEEPPYRLGFFQSATGWAYLAEPTDAAAKEAFRETAAYLGAVQILRSWARDATDPTTNHWDRSEAYWFKEGLPAFLASRRTKGPIEGQALRGPWERPPLGLVVQRRGPLDRGVFLSPRDEDAEKQGLFPPDSGYTDLAWLLVRHLNADERRGTFERFLRSQVEGTGKGVDWFEECFGIQGTEGWDALQRATYASIE